jgi:hypothetical protein
MSDSVSTFKVRVVGDGAEEAAVTSNCVLALGPFSGGSLSTTEFKVLGF